jgi:Nucleotidyltransferase domain
MFTYVQIQLRGVMAATNASTEPGSTFAPTVQVLTPEPEVPMPPDLSFGAILERFPALAKAEAVCLTGSIAAGWGNPLSDVDLYVFSDQELELPVDETMETWTSTDKSGLSWLSWVGRYGDACVDLKVWPTEALATVLAPYLAPDEPEFCALTYTPQDFIYRHSVAFPLKNDAYFDQMRELIDGSSYRRSLARSLKVLAENRLIDVAGQLAAADIMSARLTAIIAANVTADHCLVLAGELCRGEKWLLRRLQATPACGISVDEYRAEVLGGARPGQSERDCAVRIARWAQSHLIRVEPQALIFR